MTIRAVVLSFMCAAVLCGVVYFNDAVLFQNMCIGNHMPMVVFGGLLLIVLFLNPLLHVISRRLPGLAWLRPFRAGELFLFMALMLPVCAVPYSSLFRMLPRGVMLPHHFAKIDQSWKLISADKKTFTPATELLPRRMLADAEYNDGNALLEFLQGTPVPPGREHISWDMIPWGAWVDTLSFWLPQFMLIWLVLGSLALVCHKQWAENEHLPYPIVQFTRAMLPESGRMLGAVFRNKLFWVAFLIVFAIHINNYLYVYNSAYLIEFQRNIDMRPLGTLFPVFMRGGGASLCTIRVFFTAIAIAYLVQTDVSLAIGFGPYIFAVVGGILAGYGYSVREGTLLTPNIMNGWVMGGFVGFFCMMIFTGRYYYLNAVKQALGLRKTSETTPGSAWAMRLAAVAFAAFVLNLVLVGLDWPLALLYTALIVILLLVLGRIIAETGAFHLCPGLYACTVFVGFMGEQSLGPVAMITLSFITCIMMHDVREHFMPFMVNALEISRQGALPRNRMLLLTVLIIVLGMCIAAPITLYWSYDRGINWLDGTSTVLVPRQAFMSTIPARNSLMAQGTLEQAMSARGLERFGLVKPKRPYVLAFAATFVGVMLFSVARLRFVWWPLHPVMFCLWPHYPGLMMASSFILGGCLKIIVTKYGGSRSYLLLKPLMFGLIAGDMLAGLTVILSGAVYYFLTGMLPKTYWVLPG